MQFAKKQFAPGLAALQVAHTVSCCFTRPVLREGGKVPDLQTKGPADRNRRLPRRDQRHFPRWPWRRTANEKPVFCVERREQGLRLAVVLRAADEKQPSGTKREMENVERLRLRFSGQVDEEVPATDQVAGGEGRVSQT